MKIDTISTQIDHEMKTEFTDICEEVGLSSSQAIELFAKAVINYGGIPFELKIKQPKLDENQEYSSQLVKLTANYKPKITYGDKNINPSSLFGIWKGKPRDLMDIRKKAWQRN